MDDNLMYRMDQWSVRILVIGLVGYALGVVNYDWESLKALQTVALAIALALRAYQATETFLNIRHNGVVGIGEYFASGTPEGSIIPFGQFMKWLIDPRSPMMQVVVLYAIYIVLFGSVWAGLGILLTMYPPVQSWVAYRLYVRMTRV